MRQSVHAFTILATLLAATAAEAETWPSRLIKATIPFGPGSAADVVPRLVFDRLSADLGQPIVVENRAGAGGALGSALVAKAEPDGYSILAQSSALTIAPAIFPSPGFGIRLEGRWTPTYIKSDATGWWCDPYWGCYVTENAQYSNQFELSGGIVIRF